MPLFATTPGVRSCHSFDGIPAVAPQTGSVDRILDSYVPVVDSRALDVFRRATNPDDPFELRDLWLGRVEHELGPHAHRPGLAEKWKASRQRREFTADQVLSSRATVRMIKELFNSFFRDDLYGALRSDSHLLLSGGSVDEDQWGLPETLKECLRYALDRDWYGYSDSCGRVQAREAVAAYESARINGPGYTAQNVALTMGGTFAISTMADFILTGRATTSAPALCAIPNYPPLVEAVARRHEVALVPVPSTDGMTSLEPLIAALTPDTPLILLQTVANPTGAAVFEAELDRLILTASPSTIIILDECHEWLGPSQQFSANRAAANVVRVSSLSKTWSAPGLKVGWVVADSELIADYYEYASTSYGGPPSVFYTVVEVLARMERWLITGRDRLGPSEVAEFESSYSLNVPRLQAAYQSYCRDRRSRMDALRKLRDAACHAFSKSALVMPPKYSINALVEFDGWDDSYLCFRNLLRETGVGTYPGILNFCFGTSGVRITTSRPWADISAASERIAAYYADRDQKAVAIHA